ncbi:MAG: hypothetical protein COV70_03930 [Parcubacteria group bacterium CG11_big_fil_rev_8_21_14_0_20_39_22]|nr:MAG: hypothetical protein COV70_03930 [Parcubacteria group bacterium CG11_big_fil_rev_8_21_14_0_20_39_22]
MRNLTPIILLLVSVGVFFTYINPTYSGTTGAGEFKDKSIKELQADTDRYNQALQKTREIEEELNGLIDQFNAIPEEKRQRLKQLLPEHVDTVRLVIDMSALASQYSLSVKDLSLSSTGSKGSTDSSNSNDSSSASGDNIDQMGQGGGVAFSEGQGASSIGPQRGKHDSVELGFTISGEYEDFKEFLVAVERSLRIVDVSKLSFDSSEDGIYDFDITIRTYFLKS